MKLNCPMTRRESLKKIAQSSGGLALSGTLALPGLASQAPENKKFIVEATGKGDGFQVKDLVQKTFDAAGGISRFVPRGSVVALKPNLSWARAPQFAATTHPEVPI